MTERPRLMGNRLILAMGVMVAVAVSMLGISTASAESVGNTVNTLKVSPVRSDIQVKPGEKTEVAITVTNLTNNPIKIRPMTNDFVAADEKGTPSLILDETEFAKSHSLKRFMSALNEEIIPGKESKTIKVTISVPVGAQAGGYFGAVRFMPSVPDSGGQVNMAPSVASLIMLTVPGVLVEKLELSNFSIQQDGTAKTVFRDAKDLQASFRFTSSSNVQVGPFGKVSVKKGNNVVYAADFNASNPRDMILPDSARRWDVPLEKVDGFGKYTVAATLTYGTTNKAIEVEKTFWIIPTSFIVGSAIGVVLLLAIIAAIWWTLKQRSSRVRRVRRSR